MKAALRNVIPICLALLFLTSCSGPATTATETTVQESATLTTTGTTITAATSAPTTTLTPATSTPTPTPTSATTTTPGPTTTPTTPAFEFRESNPDLPDVKAALVGAFGDVEVPLEGFLLREDDLADVTLGEPAASNAVQMVLLMQAVLEADRPELLPIVEYNDAIISHGFIRNVTEASDDDTFQQEIDLFSSATGASEAMAGMPQRTVTLLTTLFEPVFDDVQIDTRNVGSTALGQEAWELVGHLTTGSLIANVRMVAVRHENLLSIITLSSPTVSASTGVSAVPRPVAYSAETDEDALALSELAIARIRAQLQSYKQTVTVDNNQFVGLLKLLPAEAFAGGKDNLTVNDYVTLRELTGAAIPDEVSNKTIEDYMEVLYGLDSSLFLRWTGSFIGGHSRWATRGPKAENVGFDLFDVDMEIFNANGLFSQDVPFFVAASGTFDPAATTRAMNDPSAWADEVEVSFLAESLNGATVYSWGDGIFDESLAFKPPLLDGLGRLFPLAVTENNVFYSDTADNVFRMLDASLGTAPSLADNSSYVSIAQHMADAGVYSFMIGSQALVNNEAFQVDESDAPLLRPFRDFGVGAGYDDLGPYMTLVLLHEDAQAAEDNSRLLVQRINETWWIRPVDWEQSWREYVDFVLVNVQDNVVTAKLYGDRAGGFWQQWIPEQRPLLLHE